MTAGIRRTPDTPLPYQEAQDLFKSKFDALYPPSDKASLALAEEPPAPIAPHWAALDALKEQIQALETGQAKRNVSAEWTPTLASERATPVNLSHLSDEEAAMIRERLASLANRRAVAIPGDVFLADVRTMTIEKQNDGNPDS